jgi:ABC-type antimicrobial peptide transport system permease subunit
MNKTTALRSLRRIATTLGTGPDSLGPVTLLAVQRPAEIVNYRSMGSTPALLGSALALGAIVALGLTLITSVRSRRRDLALLKTMGFTRRQLAASIAWQSSIALAIGVIVGVPLGIVAGRGLWYLFADQLHVVPQPTVPTLTISLIVTGALVLANLVAAIPGRQAARTKTAVLLHAE